LTIHRYHDIIKKEKEAGKMTRIVIAGSRSYEDYEGLQQAWQKHLTRHGLKEADLCIVSGGAAGADKLAERLAQEKGLRIEIHKADWQKHGKAAGPIRNAEMIAKARHCIALWDGKSPGTAMTIKTAKRKGLAVTVIQPAANWTQLAL
jgi:hypothetical protein